MTPDELAAIARAAIEAHLAGATLVPPHGGETAPAAVTLRGPAGIRGSIGTTRPDAPLPQLVARLAVAAASDDPRYLPLRPDELVELAVEVTVLADPRPVSDAAEIDPAVDALTARRGVQSALIVPGTGITNSRALLALVLAKAGLPTHLGEGTHVEARRAVVGRSPPAE